MTFKIERSTYRNGFQIQAGDPVVPITPPIAVKKRSQLPTKIQGEKTWTKRSGETGEFMSQKKEQVEDNTRGAR